ncbi:MAG: tetratricopeptide repeat-containing protein kinase family protein, partial [Halieaceae bacterium]|nr:tetratricopeptide repeat-containing protein kinase family protein [Halieaceae bacterium]
DAIAYLHENLITHRDLKAANVLVDGRGQVKVLDFGIASLLGEPLDEAPEERRLSLATAAPEQLRPGAISTATDIYALGILLYNLLAGVPPYRVTRDLEPGQIEILICERMPLPASAAAASAELDRIAAARRSSGPQLLRGLRGDLDAILARTLQKAPRDRYRSVAELREDLRRYLDNRPVSARAPSAAYRTQKFVRRYWRGLAATTATMLALAAGLGLALWQAEEARRQADRAEAMNSFMQEVLAEADPFQAGADKRVRDILDEASTRLDRRFADKPLLEAALRQSIGGVQLSLLDTGNAEANLTRALELLETRLPDDHELRLRTESHLAWLANEREDYEASMARYQVLIDRLTPAHEAELQAQLHNDFAVVLNHSGQHERAIGHLEQAMALAPDAPGRSATLVNLGYAHDGLDELETSKDYYRQAIERLRAQGKDGEVADLAYAINNYGNVLSQQGRDEEALPWYLESLEVRKRVFGPESDAVAVQHLNTGRLLLDMQRPGEALPHLTTAVELLPRYREADSIYRRVARASLARAQLLVSDDPQIHGEARANLRAVVVDLENDADTRESRFTAQFKEWLAAAEAGSD